MESLCSLAEPADRWGFKRASPIDKTSVAGGASPCVSHCLDISIDGHVFRRVIRRKAS